MARRSGGGTADRQRAFRTTGNHRAPDGRRRAADGGRRAAAAGGPEARPAPTCPAHTPGQRARTPPRPSDLPTPDLHNSHIARSAEWYISEVGRAREEPWRSGKAEISLKDWCCSSTCTLWAWIGGARCTTIEGRKCEYMLTDVSAVI